MCLRDGDKREEVESESVCRVCSHRTPYLCVLLAGDVGELAIITKDGVRWEKFDLKKD